MVFRNTKQAEEVGYTTVAIQLADNASFKEAMDRGEIVTEFKENDIENEYGNDKVQTYAASNSATFAVSSAILSSFALISSAEHLHSVSAD